MGRNHLFQPSWGRGRRRLRLFRRFSCKYSAVAAFVCGAWSVVTEVSTTPSPVLCTAECWPRPSTFRLPGFPDTLQQVVQRPKVDDFGRRRRHRFLYLRFLLPPTPNGYRSWRVMLFGAQFTLERIFFSLLTQVMAFCLHYISAYPSIILCAPSVWRCLFFLALFV